MGTGAEERERRDEGRGDVQAGGCGRGRQCGREGGRQEGRYKRTLCSYSPKFSKQRSLNSVLLRCCCALPLLQAVADWKPVASPPSPRQTENEKNIDDGLNAFIELIHQTKENKDS